MIRTGFIGGSDCVKIMQGKWLELWEVKTGKRESDDLSNNIAVQLGTFTEDFNLSWFEKQHDVTLKNHQLELEEELYHTDAGVVPIKGTLDATFGKCIVEAKHTNAFNTMDGLLEYYMPQIQCYLWLTRSSLKFEAIEGCYLSAIFGNSKWESAFVAANKEYQRSMWKMVADFWGYVNRNEQPNDYDQSTAVSQDKIEVDGMVKRDASKENGFVSAAYDYLKFKDEAKLFESSKKDLKSMVKQNEREVYSDIISIRRSKNGSLRIVEPK
tara:strand:- start:30 stop:836 length:807 start_codon:yes stop_codon:yes gene_type:complete